MEHVEKEGATCECKVGRMIESYELTEANRRMVDAWTAEDDNQSLRVLAERFNEELLRERMRRQDLTPLDGEVSNTYRLLTDDDVSRGMRTQTRKRLERQGLDVDRLLDDFVSYQTIYRHLNGCLDAEYTQNELPDEARREKAQERILGLENRTETVTRDALVQLADADALALDEFDVLVDVTVICLHCHSHYSIDDVIDGAGCDCRAV